MDIDDDNTFPNELVEQCVHDAAEQVLQEAMWDEAKVPHWINEICEKTMKLLMDLKRPYKYVVTCMLMQKGAQAHGSTAGYWENTTDGYVSIAYPP